MHNVTSFVGRQYKKTCCVQKYRKTHVSSRSSAPSAYTWGIFQRLQIQGVEKLGRSKPWNAGIGLWPPGCEKIGDFGLFNQLKMVNFMMANGDHIMHYNAAL
jgi:hypothetical protein